MLNVRQRRAALARAELEDLIHQCGVGRAATLLDVYEATVQRWLAGTSRVPRAALIALRAAVRGQLPGMEHKDWEGFGIGHDGLLYEGRNSWSVADIRSLHWKNQQIEALERRIKMLTELVEKLGRPSAGHGAANDAAIL